MLNKVKGKPVRARTTPSAALLAAPAPATRPEAS